MRVHRLTDRPALVVAPLSTLVHWKRETETWTDQNAIILGANNCAFVKKHEIGQPNKVVQPFDTLITSYEVLRTEASFLGKISFGAVCWTRRTGF